MSDSRENVFDSLCREARNCGLCENLRERAAVLSSANGDLRARVMFVGEAPGRAGGDRTRQPFSGDASGNNFQRFIDSIGLRREELFITNAVLCNPRKPSGANRKPSVGEIKNCSAFLRRQIELIDPRIIVTLGGVALEALKAVEYHQFSLKTDAGEILRWNGRFLIPLYHPSPQVLASHRREREQLADYRTVAEAVRRVAESE